MPASQVFDIRGQQDRKPRLWPALALLPVLLAGNALKSAGITTVLGVDITVMSMVILLIATAATFLRHPRYPMAEMIPIIVFATVVLLGVARSEPGDYQALKARDFFLLSGVIIACVPVLLRDVRDLRGLLMTWILAGSTASMFVLLVGGADALYGREGIGEATLGPGYVAAAGLVAAGGAWGDRLLSAPLALPLVGLNAWALVGIGSRGPLLGAALGLLAWALMRGLFRSRVFASSAAVCVGLAFAFTRASSVATDRLFFYEDAARSNLWQIALSVFPDAPILGIGWGDYSTVSWASYPHNLFLETQVELGLIGVLALLGVLLAAAKRTWKSRGQPEARVLGAVAFAMFVGQQFSFDLTNRIFWIALVSTLVLPAVFSRAAGPVKGARPGAAVPSRLPSQA